MEDKENKTKAVANLLREIYYRQTAGFKFTHLNIVTPQNFKTKQTEPNWLKPRGVWQRNKALHWLRNNVVDTNGIVYFGDDDNTYDLKLFDEIRKTSKVSVFPVGLVGGLLVERPIVQNSKVVSFNSMWKTTRTYPIDMAGFSIKLDLILENNNAYFSENVSRGLQETDFLKQLIDSINDLEPRAQMCQKTLVWHTRTEKPRLNQERKLRIPSNFGMID